MNDFSDVLFLIAAMAVFGMLTINTARNFQVTSNHTYQTDLEFRAISLAQDEIDAIRWLEEEDLFDSGDSDYLFEDDPITKTLTYGENDEYSESFTITRSSTKITDDAFGNDRYKIEVTVESDAISPEITGTLEYIKTFEIN